MTAEFAAQQIIGASYEGDEALTERMGGYEFEFQPHGRLIAGEWVPLGHGLLIVRQRGKERAKRNFQHARLFATGVRNFLREIDRDYGWVDDDVNPFAADEE